MDVPVSALRAELAKWISYVHDGEEVVVTDRGIPVARLIPVGAAPQLEQLTNRGVLVRPELTRRPRARGATRVRSDRPVSDIVSEQRD